MRELFDLNEPCYKPSKTKEGFGNCFDVHYSFIRQCFLEKIKGVLLVHGEVEGSEGRWKGQRFGHAWLELVDSGEVVDLMIGVKVSIDEYYKYVKVAVTDDKLKKYDPDTAINMREQYRNNDPWEVDVFGIKQPFWQKLKHFFGFGL